MSVETRTATNVKQAVPFFGVRNIDASLAFYVDGLGFTLTNKWTPDNRIRWCWLELGGAAVMLQEYRPERKPAERVGAGVSVCFMCNDALALYHDFIARGIQAQPPFVGNALWVMQVSDPDGYKLLFESPTDVPEETMYCG